MSNKTGHQYAINIRIKSPAAFFGFLAAMFLATLFYAAAPAYAADERILAFHSDVTVHEDSTLTVTETIRVRSTGQQIRRGIYREFPTRYQDDRGYYFTLGFTLRDVTRDGRPEPHRVERGSNMRRIYIGQEDVFLSPGEYTYRITYEVSRALIFHEDMDELYWNVTGDAWHFPIDAASVALRLPQGARVAEYVAYTGREGSRETDYAEAGYTQDGAFALRATRPLAPREGLTVSLAFSKGFVDELSSFENLMLLIANNKIFVFSLLYTVLLTAYFIIAWMFVGKNPPKGTIIPRFAPPEGFSPALCAYVLRMGLKGPQVAFTAALVSMGVKGYLTITESEKGEFTISCEKNDFSKLPPGEQSIADAMFASGRKTYKIPKRYDAEFAAIFEGFSRRVQDEHQGVYFSNNLVFSQTPLLLSIPAVSLNFMSFNAGLVTDIQLFIIAGALLVLHLMFTSLMRAPTVYGREKMDEIEGFKLYLETAEKLRLDAMHPPKMTPEIFEKFLPYAMALGVENKWAGYFTKSIPEEQYRSYRSRRSHWYRGRHASFGAVRMCTGLSRSLSSGLTRASRSSSSGGRGGGGRSGGGRGGGGGGGW